MAVLARSTQASNSPRGQEADEDWSYDKIDIAGWTRSPAKTQH